MKRFLPILLICLICLTGCTSPQIQQPSLSPTPVVESTPTPTPTPIAEPAPSVIAFNRSTFPRLNGSTSTAPLGRAIASVLLGESEEEVSDLIQFSRTTQSFRDLMWGSADLLIAAEPSLSVLEELDQNGFEITMEPFAYDGLIFVVNADNPVDSLTIEQLQGIYTGEITNWSQVGGDDLPIVPFQRNAEAGSQTLMQKLVMDGLTMMEPPEDYMIDSMAGLMEAVRGYDNTAGAIGYSVYYYASDMRMAEGMKIIAVNGVEPSTQTIRSGEYPLCNPYYVAMAADTPQDSMIAILYNWILSEDGQRLVSQMGYASVLDPSASASESTTQVTVHWDVLAPLQTNTILANRWYEDYTDDLIPSDEYGQLIPYIGGEVSNTWWGSGWCYGLATTDGTIVTDPVFMTATYSGYYDQNTYCTIYPEPYVLLLGKAVGEEYLYALAAGDGSWYTGLIYTATLCASQDGRLMLEASGDIVMINWHGQEVFRWVSDEIPLPDFQPNELMFRSRGTSGHWYCYVSYESGNEDYYYVDLRTGAVQNTMPADWDGSGPERPAGALSFGGGWYVTTEGNIWELHYYSGEVYQYPIPDGFGYKISSVDGDRVLLYQGNSAQTCTLTDMEGNVLVEAIDNYPFFTTNYGTGPSLLCSTTYDQNYSSTWTTVLDRDGNKLLTTRDGSLRQFGNRLIFADDNYYRLTDLDGNDLIRLPRFSAAD